jgi:sugar phosphate isomerase/epimerase
MTTARFGIIARHQREWRAALGFAAQRGFDHVELRLDRMLPDDPVSQPGFLDDIAETAANFDLSLSLHGMNDVDCNAKVAQVRDAIRGILCAQRRMAERVNARWLVIHTGRGHCVNTRERKAPKIRRCATMLAEVLNETSACSVPLALENLPKMAANYGRCYFGDCLAELDDIAAQVDSEALRFVWDFGHSKVGVPPTLFEQELRQALEHPRLVAFHMHTNDGTSDQHKPFDDQTSPSDLGCLLALMAQAEAGIPAIFETDWDEALLSRETLAGLWEEAGKEVTECV